jgi:hypothetical protein
MGKRGVMDPDDPPIPRDQPKLLDESLTHLSRPVQAGLDALQIVGVDAGHPQFGIREECFDRIPKQRFDKRAHIEQRVLLVSPL